MLRMSHGDAARTAAVHAALSEDLRRWFGRRAPADRVDDLVQESFLRIHTALPTLRDPDRLAPWVVQIARNVWIDGLRRERPTEPLQVVPVAAPEPTDPNEIVAAWLPGFIDALPPPYRDALRWSELDGLTQSEVARRLGLSPSGARTRIQRGRKLLRAELEACCEIQREGAQVVDFHPRAPCGCGATDPQGKVVRR